MRKGILHFDELPHFLKMIGVDNDIPIMEGQHHKDIDIDEGRLDSLTAERMRYICDLRMQANGMILEEDGHHIPVGFNFGYAEKYGGILKWDDDE